MSELEGIKHRRQNPKRRAIPGHKQRIRPHTPELMTTRFDSKVTAVIDHSLPNTLFLSVGIGFEINRLEAPHTLDIDELSGVWRADFTSSTFHSCVMFSKKTLENAPGRQAKCGV